ncbi:MAG: sirohydrochlorin chelatase [Opitutales bacterium]
MNTPAIFLVDNGSLRPQATLALRDLATRLSARTDKVIEAVSLLHSHKLEPEQLGGVPATIVKRRMRELIREGVSQFIVLPLFLGPSLAITDYLPSIVDELRQSHPDLSVFVANPVAGADVEHPEPRLSIILEEHLLSIGAEDPDVCLALVDHGTPIRPVNHLRDSVARQLSERLGKAVQPCSMERRQGLEYAFNDPLLENLIDLENCSGRKLLLAMFFLLPGRHAGEGGDVSEIADGLLQAGAFESIRTSPLLGEHPLLLDILADRLEQVIERRFNRQS